MTNLWPGHLGDFIQVQSAETLTALDLVNTAMYSSTPHGGVKNIIRQ